MAGRLHAGQRHDPAFGHLRTGHPRRTLVPPRRGRAASLLASSACRTLNFGFLDFQPPCLHRRPSRGMQGHAVFTTRSPSPRIMKINSIFKAIAGSIFLASSFPAFAGGQPSDQLAGISANGRLVLFRSDDPEAATTVKIRGLQKKEKLLAIDVRPLNGQIYGLGSTSRIYTINRTTGQATAVAGPPTRCSPASRSPSTSIPWSTASASSATAARTFASIRTPG
ncbi:MAG: hypothetical protein B9S38_07660 [Verrucomicrobiia bacterium Tous-C4TDCM]|nr:MAG: hypothetical protein B9S38_07660 [Verrucomicrobiae bacterium Tous-C4TDCM]